MYASSINRAGREGGIRTHIVTSFELAASSSCATSRGGTDWICTSVETFCRRLRIYSATVPFGEAARNRTEVS